MCVLFKYCIKNEALKISIEIWGNIKLQSIILHSLVSIKCCHVSITSNRARMLLYFSHYARNIVIFSRVSSSSCFYFSFPIPSGQSLCFHHPLLVLLLPSDILFQMNCPSGWCMQFVGYWIIEVCYVFVVLSGIYLLSASLVIEFSNISSFDMTLLTSKHTSLTETIWMPFWKQYFIIQAKF